jgi:hypothetical protein
MKLKLSKGSSICGWVGESAMDPLLASAGVFVVDTVWASIRSVVYAFVWDSVYVSVKTSIDEQNTFRPKRLKKKA